MEMHIGLSGSYELTVRNQAGEITKQLAFENLILNQGLDAIGGNGELFAQGVKCKLGTGSTVPAVTDTALSGTASGFSDGDSGANVTGNITTPPYWSECSFAMTFPIGALSGNYTEIGLYSYYGNTLFSRALIKDSGGNPTTLTILATEELHVTYKLRLYPPMTDTTGTFSMTYNGTPTTYNYTIRYSNFNITGIYPFTVFSSLKCGLLSDAVLSAKITGDMTGTTVAESSTASSSTYIAGTYYRDITYTCNTNNSNFAAGISGVRFNSVVFSGSNTGWAHSQCLISPPIMKTATDTLSLTFRISWGRV